MGIDVLAVTKDYADFYMFYGPLSELRKSGYRVEVVAEGHSLKKWTNSGWDIYGGYPKEGSFDPDTGFRSDLFPENILFTLRPKVVMVGLARPMNLGEKFAETVQAFNNVNIFGRRTWLGFCEDLWGVHTRCSVTPDFICTLDKKGKALIESQPRYEKSRPKVFVTGSPLVDRMFFYTAKDEVTDEVARHYSQVVLMVGQDESTTPMLDGLLSAVGLHGRTLLIPRLHPKFANLPEAPLWREKLLSARGIDIFNPSMNVETDQLVLSAHHVVGVFSNMLIVAAVHGKMAVSWASEVGREAMAKALGGLTSFPLVDYGCAIEVRHFGSYNVLVPSADSGEYKIFVHQAKKRAHQEFQLGTATYNIANAIRQYLY